MSVTDSPSAPSAPSAPRAAATDPWSASAPPSSATGGATTDPWSNSASPQASRHEAAAATDPWGETASLKPSGKSSGTTGSDVDGSPCGVRDSVSSPRVTSTSKPTPRAQAAVKALPHPRPPLAATAPPTSNRVGALPNSASPPWTVSSKEKAKYDTIFEGMSPNDGKVSGSKIAPVLKRSGLPTATLHNIWNLVDVAQDGALNSEWFAVAMHLTMKTKRGEPLAETLSADLIPPSAR